MQALKHLLQCRYRVRSVSATFCYRWHRGMSRRSRPGRAPCYAFTSHRVTSRARRCLRSPRPCGRSCSACTCCSTPTAGWCSRTGVVTSAPRWRRTRCGCCWSSPRVKGYSPDFLTPAESATDFETALELLLSTPQQQIRSQLDLLSKYRPVSPWTRELAEGDRASLRKLGGAIKSYHDAAIAPYWKSIGTHVTADHAYRGDALARYGVDRLLSSLHPRVRWVAPVLQVLDMNDRDLYLDGRGIELQPSAFCWQVPTKLRDPDLKPILVYPIQHAPGILRQASLEPTPARRRSRLPARVHPRRRAGGRSDRLYDDRAGQALQHLPGGSEPPSDRTAGGRADHHAPGRCVRTPRGDPARYLAALRPRLRRSPPEHQLRRQLTHPSLLVRLDQCPVQCTVQARTGRDRSLTGGVRQDRPERFGKGHSFATHTFHRRGPGPDHACRRAGPAVGGAPQRAPAPGPGRRRPLRHLA